MTILVLVWLLLVGPGSSPAHHGIAVPGIATEQDCEKLASKIAHGWFQSHQCISYEAAP